MTSKTLDKKDWEEIETCRVRQGISEHSLKFLNISFICIICNTFLQTFSFLNSSAFLEFSFDWVKVWKLGNPSNPNRPFFSMKFPVQELQNVQGLHAVETRPCLRSHCLVNPFILVTVTSLYFYFVIQIFGLRRETPLFLGTIMDESSPINAIWENPSPQNSCK